MSVVPAPRAQAGFGYVEVLIATLLVAVSLAPALEALSGGIRGASIGEQMAEDAYLLAARLETVLAEPFAALEAAAAGTAVASSYSDTATAGDGRQVTRSVYIAAYDGNDADADGNPFTGTDPDLLWVRVEIPGTAADLETLTSR